MIFMKIVKHTSDKEVKKLIAFDEMIATMLTNEKPNLVVTELFMRDRKLNISFVFITKYYFAVPKNIRITSIHYFLCKSQRNESFPKFY